MPRTESYNEEISKKLKNPKYAQTFLETLMEGPEGLSPEDALRHTIEIMGVKEFAKLAKVSSPRVVEFTKGKRHLKPDTLDIFLKPFKLRTRIIFETAS
ncbi:MAG: hypothetical protein COV44_11930 [Deltaproteobacteria bacterium CG11_big_fil_rev_8_21_14_0_20_45_16]|nr:MAG: hypothetical protein COV44_11930 [Deltaproteobacteria bacterium CG11_big_fil_rev_8_21_14_0_20_45_16]